MKKSGEKLEYGCEVHKKLGAICTKFACQTFCLAELNYFLEEVIKLQALLLFCNENGGVPKKTYQIYELFDKFKINKNILSQLGLEDYLSFIPFKEKGIKRILEKRKKRR